MCRCCATTTYVAFAHTQQTPLKTVVPVLWTPQPLRAASSPPTPTTIQIWGVVSSIQFIDHVLGEVEEGSRPSTADFDHPDGFYCLLSLGPALVYQEGGGVSAILHALKLTPERRPGNLQSFPTFPHPRHSQGQRGHEDQDQESKVEQG